MSLAGFNWLGEEIVPVRKEFNFEHPNVQSMTKEEIHRMHRRLGVEVQCEEGVRSVFPACSERVRSVFATFSCLGGFRSVFGVCFQCVSSVFGACSERRCFLRVESRHSRA